MRYGFRKIEAIIITLVSTIALCFALQIFTAKPDWGGVGMGLITPALPDKEALFIALGILGATVMPHNLYLHSSIVQTRAFDAESPNELKEAVRGATADTVIALAFAFFVNAAILIVSSGGISCHGQSRNCRSQRRASDVDPTFGRCLCNRICGCATRFRAVIHDNRNFGRADCDGGLPEHPDRPLATAGHHAWPRDHPGHHPHPYQRRKRHGPALDLVPGRAVHAAFLAPSS